MASPSVPDIHTPERDESTIRPTNLPLARIGSLYVSSSNDSPSASRVSLVAVQKLQDYFPPRNDSKAPEKQYTDASLQEIANLLRISDQGRWSTIPRIYTVLRNIGHLQVIDEFVKEGSSDIWFPFTTRNLPPKLSPSIKAQFLAAQSIVFTPALDIERDGGKHATFATEEPLCFESIGKLGKGAFGAVDKVVSLITLRQYARKRMRRGPNFTKSKNEIRAFKAELAILKTVDHRHCVKLVGSYTDPIYLGLIMSPVADCDLSTFLTDALTDADKRSVLRTFFGCLANALSYLHGRQIRHRDIKPASILVKRDQVYLADFGIALDFSELTRGTTTADTAKSPIYCAPEVARSEPRGVSADIWSLGCVFIEMISVLKGRSVQTMRSYFTQQSNSYMFHHNVRPCIEWLADLRALSSVDNPPIEWSQRMYVVDREERCTADELLELIQSASQHDPTRFVNQAFCGDCCMDEGHTSSGNNTAGEDPWADSNDEETETINKILQVSRSEDEVKSMPAPESPRNISLSPQYVSTHEPSPKADKQSGLPEPLLLSRFGLLKPIPISNDNDWKPRQPFISTFRSSQQAEAKATLPLKPHHATASDMSVFASNEMKDKSLSPNISSSQDPFVNHSAELGKNHAGVSSDIVGTFSTPSQGDRGKPENMPVDRLDRFFDPGEGGRPLSENEKRIMARLPRFGELTLSQPAFPRPSRTAMIPGQSDNVSQPTTHIPQPTTHIPLPTAHLPLPTTHIPLPTTIRAKSSNHAPEASASSIITCFYKLLVRVISADSLYKRELFGFPNPIATVTLDGQTTRSTSIVTRSLNPHWDESFEFDHVSEYAELEVEVIDIKRLQKADRGKLGSARLRIGDWLRDDNPRQKLVQNLQMSSNVVYGQITYELTSLERTTQQIAL